MTTATTELPLLVGLHLALAARGRAGDMRTCTVRDVLRSPSGTRLVVDIVVHDGASGPGNAWALAARPGDGLALMAPRRGHAYGGIEWSPEAGRRLLAGDETALPAIAAILEQLPATARGTDFGTTDAADLPGAELVHHVDPRQPRRATTSRPVTAPGGQRRDAGRRPRGCGGGAWGGSG